MTRSASKHGVPTQKLRVTIAVVTTAVVLTAYLELAAEVHRLAKPWGPYLVRIVIMAAFWAAMMRGYLQATKMAVQWRRWWLFVLATLVAVGAMVVAVVYRLFVNVQGW